MDHIHKYMRVVVNTHKIIRENGRRKIIKQPGYEVFKCVLEGCSHYKSRELAIGAKTMCWKCGNELVLTMENTTLKKPTHPWCRKTKTVACCEHASADGKNCPVHGERKTA